MIPGQGGLSGQAPALHLLLAFYQEQAPSPLGASVAPSGKVEAFRGCQLGYEARQERHGVNSIGARREQGLRPELTRTCRL